MSISKSMNRAPSVSILLIGNELLSGDIQDTNGRFLLQKLRETSLEAVKLLYVKDDLSSIIENIQNELRENTLVLCSGGLGPTSDDMTIEAVAKALNLPLEEDPESLARLKEKYKKRDRPLNPNSFKQTCFPKGAHIFPNPVGTADACIIHAPNSKDGDIRAVACFPGVPKEFQVLVETELWNWMNEHLDIEKDRCSLEFRVFGLSESHVASVIDENSLIPDQVEIAYRPQFPELLISLNSLKLSPSELASLREKIIGHIGAAYCFSMNKDEKLPQRLGNLLRQNGATLAAAESCSGGRLSSELLKRAGASSYFSGSVVSYSNAMKEGFLEVPRGLLERKGAVSEECALAMVDGISQKTGATFSVSITGIAGPDGGTEEKEVGTVYIAIKTPETRKSYLHHLHWDRERNQIYASWLAMDLIRRAVLNLPLEHVKY